MERNVIEAKVTGEKGGAVVGEHVGMQCGHDGDEELQRQRHRLQPRNNTTNRQLRMSRDKMTVRAGGRGVANFEFAFRDGFNDEAPVTHRAVLVQVHTRLQTQMKHH